MKPSEIKIGQRVICPTDSTDVGIVHSFSASENIAWVRWPIPGNLGRHDLLDMDPADLEPAP